MQMWDVHAEGGGQVVSVLHDHTKPVTALDARPGAASNGGDNLASASHGPEVSIWTTPRRTRLQEGHANTVTAVAYSPDGSLLASASWDARVIVQAADSSGGKIVLEGSGFPFCGFAGFLWSAFVCLAGDLVAIRWRS